MGVTEIKITLGCLLISDYCSFYEQMNIMNILYSFLSTHQYNGSTLESPVKRKKTTSEEKTSGVDVSSVGTNPPPKKRKIGRNDGSGEVQEFESIKTQCTKQYTIHSNTPCSLLGMHSCITAIDCIMVIKI